jgi:ParB family chromosome partitioning protein
MSIRSNLLLSLGILHWRKGALDTALEHLNQALEISSRIKEARLQAACFNAIAIVQTDLGLVDEAIDSYRKTIALAPDQNLTWNNLGNLYEKLGRFEAAIEAFTQVLERTPSDALAWNGLGNVYLKQRKNAEAVAAYKQSIEFAPNLAHPWNGLGNAYASRGDFEIAIPAYQRSVELNKDFSFPWINLGDLYQEQGNNQEALKAYWNAVRIDSRNPQIWNSLGNAYMSSGMCAEAIKSYHKAIKLNRNYESAYTNLAAAYSLVGNFEEAVAYYQKSVELLSGQKQPSAQGQIEQTYRQLVLAALDEPESEETDAEAVELDDPVEAQIKAMLQEIDPAFESEAETETELLDDEPEESEIEDPAELEAVAEAALEPVQPLITLPDCLSKDSRGALRTDPDEVAADSPLVEEVLPVQAAEPESGLPQAITELQINHLFAVAEETCVEMPASACELEVTPETETLPEPPANPEPAADLPEPEPGAETEPPTIEIVFQDIELPVDFEMLASAEEPTVDATPLEAVSAAALPVAAPEADAVETAPVSVSALAGDDQPELTLESRIERMPKDAFVWNELGNIYFNISEYEEAVAAYKQAIKLDSSLGWSYNNLALAYSLQGRYDEAIQVYGKIIYLLTTPDEKISWRGPGNTRINSHQRVSLRQIAEGLADQGEPMGVSMREMPVEDIYVNPENPRAGLEVTDLLQSVREQGILQPLIVTPNGKPGKYLLVSGRRRLEAARQVGLQKVPVIVRAANSREKMEFELVERALGPDLSPIELAETYLRLAEEFLLSYEEIAARVGRSRGEIASTLNLLKLSAKVKQALAERQITEGHACALLALSTSLAQDILLKNILEKKLSVLQTEELVRNSVGRKPSFLFAEEAEPEAPETEETAHPISSLRRKEAKPGEFSLLSRARSVLRSNYQPAHSLDGSPSQPLAQEGGVHE